jgi:glutathione S-transferase
MSDIHKHITISAPIDWVWAALTDATTMSIWMQDNEVKVDLREGGTYTYFGGETSGHFTHIMPSTLLEYTWRQNGWQKSWEDSLVRWELHPEGTSTHIHLIHSRFPNTNERDSHDEGWDMYWLAPMQDWLEHG